MPASSRRGWRKPVLAINSLTSTCWPFSSPSPTMRLPGSTRSTRVTVIRVSSPRGMAKGTRGWRPVRRNSAAVGVATGAAGGCPGAGPAGPRSSLVKQLDLYVLGDGGYRGAKLVVDGDIGGIAAIADGHIAAPEFALGGVEGIPASPHIGLEPGVQVHGLEAVEIAHHKAGGNAQAATQGNPQVGQIPAHPRAAAVDLDGGDGHVAAAGNIADVVAQPVADGRHLVVAQQLAGGDLGGHLAKAV